MSHGRAQHLKSRDIAHKRMHAPGRTRCCCKRGGGFLVRTRWRYLFPAVAGKKGWLAADSFSENKTEVPCRNSLNCAPTHWNFVKTSKIRMDNSPDHRLKLISSSRPSKVTQNAKSNVWCSICAWNARHQTNISHVISSHLLPNRYHKLRPEALNTMGPLTVDRSGAVNRAGILFTSSSLSIFTSIAAPHSSDPPRKKRPTQTRESGAD